MRNDSYSLGVVSGVRSGDEREEQLDDRSGSDLLNSLLETSGSGGSAYVGENGKYCLLLKDRNSLSTKIFEGSPRRSNGYWINNCIYTHPQEGRILLSGISEFL